MMSAVKEVADLLRAASESDATITFVDGARTTRLDYRSLLVSAQEMSERIVSAVGPQRQCIILCDQNLAFVKQFWACMEAGWQAVIVPVSNSSQAGSLLGPVMAQHPNPVVAVSSAAAAQALVGAGAGGSVLDLGDDLWLVPGAGNPSASAPTAPIVQYSSGSAGSPKGVLIDAGNIDATVRAAIERFAITRDDSGMAWLPLTHVFSLFAFHTVAMYAKVDQTIQRTSDFLFDPLSWMDQVSLRGATVTGSPNFGYQYFLQALARHGGRDWDLSRLRLVLNGAEEVSVELVARFEAALAPYGARPGMVLSAYGLSEATVAVATATPGTAVVCRRMLRSSLSVGQRVVVEPDGDAGSTVVVAAVGHPFGTVQVRLTDEAVPVVDGTVGEIEIRGPQVTVGYHGGDTGGSFTSDGWLRTGDVGVRLDGELYILGRVKDMLIINGVNYWPDDLEHVVGAQLPALGGHVAVVAGRNTDTQTEEVVVFVESGDADPGSLPGDDQIRSAVAAVTGLRVAKVVTVEQLPRTQSGKVRRFLLQQSLTPAATHPVAG